LIKSAVLTFKFLQTFRFQINHVLLNVLFVKESKKINFSISKNIKQQDRFLHKCFLSKSKLDRFLKDHVTMKTVMMLKIQL